MANIQKSGQNVVKLKENDMTDMPAVAKQNIIGQFQIEYQTDLF